MRPEPVDITLGGETFEIRPLTLRQTRDIEIVTARGDYATQTDRLVAILDVVLRRDHADRLPADGAIDMEVMPSELQAAAVAIKTLAGMRDVPAGEAEAATPAANNSGEASMGG
jgi:hypothetical protein